VSNLGRKKCEHLESVLFVRLFPLLFTFNINANIIRHWIQRRKFHLTGIELRREGMTLLHSAIIFKLLDSGHRITNQILVLNPASLNKNLYHNQYATQHCLINSLNWSLEQVAVTAVNKSILVCMAYHLPKPVRRSGSRCLI
jgi:hypothetical protein